MTEIKFNQEDRTDKYSTENIMDHSEDNVQVLYLHNCRLSVSSPFLAVISMYLHKLVAWRLRLTKYGVARWKGLKKADRI